MVSPGEDSSWRREAESRVTILPVDRRLGDPRQLSAWFDDFTRVKKARHGR